MNFFKFIKLIIPVLVVDWEAGLNFVFPREIVNRSVPLLLWESTSEEICVASDSISVGGFRRVFLDTLQNILKNIVYQYIKKII